MKRILFIWLFITSAACHGRAADIWVEAESFDTRGGWLVDQQFMDVMGSPYLIAHGIGTPVADASTTVTVPADGNYKVYVRTYNWTSPWDKRRGPGKFRLSVNGKKTTSVLGDTGTEWMWQLAGKVSLKRGKAVLKLHDLTGFDGRCDAVYLTTDNQMPPNDAEALKTFRKSRLCLPDQAPSAGTFDIVVVGGGIAGISAAVTAARLGLKVALIQDRPVLGGNNSSEIRVHLGGRIDVGKYPHLGGLQKEFGPTEEGNAMPAFNYADDMKTDIVKREPNISLFLNHHVNEVIKAGDKILAVVAQNTLTSQNLRFDAPLFADCTGDGTVGHLAGADFRMGREAREEFDETLAPDVADNMKMGASVQWYSTDNGKPCKFPSFDYGIRFNDDNAEKVYKGEWTWETGMYKDPINEMEQIRDFGMLVVYANWSFLKNHSAEKSDFRNRRLEWVAYITGKRESRRLLGDYILSEQDLTKNVSHEDASFTTTWSIDLHYPDSLNSARFPGKEFKADTRHTVIYPYAVPYRCLYSRNVDNLFMAGRNISVTHVALGTVRVMRTTGMMGEVVGMAASLCRKYDVNPRGIYTRHLRDLQALMKQGVGGQDLPNNQQYNEGGWLSQPPIVR